MDVPALSVRLRALREACGLTKKALADAAGICIGAYNHYEKGDRCMPVYALDRLCKALGTTPNELMGYEATGLSHRD